MLTNSKIPVYVEKRIIYIRSALLFLESEAVIGEFYRRLRPEACLSDQLKSCKKKKSKEITVLYSPSCLDIQCGPNSAQWPKLEGIARSLIIKDITKTLLSSEATYKAGQQIELGSNTRFYLDDYYSDHCNTSWRENIFENVVNYLI